MLKKKTITKLLMVVLAICCLCLPAAAQTDADVLAAFAEEAPISEADIQTFIKIAPQLIEAVDANDEAKAVDVMAKAGWNEIRGAYATSKIGNGYLMLTDPEDTQTLFELVQMPDSLIPAENEMALIKKYEADLAKIFQ